MKKDEKCRPINAAFGMIYLSGKMRGLPDLGRGAFMEVEKFLRDKGFIVLNPAVLPVDLKPESYMPICMAMVREADHIVMLPGYEDSRGALLELNYALECGKTAFELEAFYRTGSPLKGWIMNELKP